MNSIKMEKKGNYPGILYRLRPKSRSSVNTE